MFFDLGLCVTIQRIAKLLFFFLILAACKKRGESVFPNWQIGQNQNSNTQQVKINSDEDMGFPDSGSINLVSKEKKTDLPMDLLIPTARTVIECESYGGAWIESKQICEQTSESCDAIYWGLEVHPDDHSRCILLKAEAGSKESCLWSGGAWDESAGPRHHCQYSSVACARIYPGSVVDPNDKTQCINKAATVEE